MKKLGKIVIWILVILLIYNLFVFTDFGGVTVGKVRGTLAAFGADCVDHLTVAFDSLHGKLQDRASKYTFDSAEDTTAESSTSSTPKSTAPAQVKATATPVSKNSTASSDFKKTMDDYETTIDDYIAFMKRFSENPSDYSLLLKYASWMTKYAKLMDDLEAIDEDSLSSSDYSYYMTVMNRINKKLLDAASYISE